MPDQPVMRVTPVFLRDNFLQFVFRFQGVGAFSQPQPVGHPENMGIHCNSRNMVNDAAHHVGGFLAYTGQFPQRRNILRQLAVIFFQQHVTHAQQIFCLGPE